MPAHLNPSIHLEMTNHRSTGSIRRAFHCDARGDAVTRSFAFETHFVFELLEAFVQFIARLQRRRPLALSVSGVVEIAALDGNE